MDEAQDILVAALYCSDDIDDVAGPLVDFLTAHSRENFLALLGKVDTALDGAASRGYIERQLQLSLDRLHYSRPVSFPPVLKLARARGSARYEELARLAETLAPGQPLGVEA